MTSLMFWVGETLRLWTGDAPLALGKKDHDIPTLTAYLPKEPKYPVSVVVCPGGGYAMLAEHEGRDYAEFLAMNGISAYVLKYRLGSNGYRHPAMLIDAQRAIRQVRSLHPGFSVGIMGSSAGGHLAATASVHYNLDLSLRDGGSQDEIDKLNAKPDFTVLCYPVTSFTPPVGHAWSGKQLLGEAASSAQMELMDLPNHVNSQTPPAFLWHTVEDDGVPIENSIRYALALRKSGVPFDLHIFEKGKHGIGLADKSPYENAHPWGANLIYWIRTTIIKA